MPQQQQNPLLSLLFPFLILAFFWFFMIRPQQQAQKKRREMLANLKKGDQVVTIGGIHGTIVDLGPETATLQVGRGLEITIDRAAVGRVKGAGEAK